MTNDILLIIECCKISQNSDLIESYLKNINNWDAFMSLAYSHGIFPLVYKTLKEFEDIIPKQIFAQMKITNMNVVKQNMMMTSELIKVLKILEEKNIEAITFKGPSLSQMAYGDVISRQYVDLDILIDESLLSKAQNIMEQNSYEPTYDLEEYQKENLKDVVHDISMINKTNGINIELHWTLSSGEFFIDLEKLHYMSDTKKYSLLNHDIRIFSNEKLFIYLCVHGYKHLWERIEWLVDIYYLISKENIDLEKAIEMSESVDADRIVLSTLIICNKIFNLENKIKIEDSNLFFYSNKIIKKIFDNYEVKEKNHSKYVSKIQWYMLKNYKNRFKYLSSLFHPTEEDFKILKLPKMLSFLYYPLRFVNIFYRILKSKIFM